MVLFWMERLQNRTNHQVCKDVKFNYRNKYICDANDWQTWLLTLSSVSCISYEPCQSLKGTGQWGGFSGVSCINWIVIDLLHYLSSRSDFGIEFAEIYCIRNRKTTSQLAESAIRFSITNISANSKPKSETARNVVYIKVAMPNRFMQKPRKIGLIDMSL